MEGRRLLADLRMPPNLCAAVLAESLRLARLRRLRLMESAVSAVRDSASEALAAAVPEGTVGEHRKRLKALQRVCTGPGEHAASAPAAAPAAALASARHRAAPDLGLATVWELAANAEPTVANLAWAQLVLETARTARDEAALRSTQALTLSAALTAEAAGFAVNAASCGAAAGAEKRAAKAAYGAVVCVGRWGEGIETVAFAEAWAATAEARAASVRAQAAAAELALVACGADAPLPPKYQDIRRLDEALLSDVESEEGEGDFTDDDNDVVNEGSLADEMEAEEEEEEAVHEVEEEESV